MGTVERSIEVDVPTSTAYGQWARFEEFPHFMEGVEEIRQLDAHLFWRVNLAGTTREFHAEVVEQRPDERIAWRSSEGAMHSGVVTFEGVGESRTRVSVRIEEEPDGVAERVGEAIGLLDERVRGDLERFKRLVEGHGRDSLRRFGRSGEEAPADADTVAAPGEAGTGGTGSTPLHPQAGF